MPDFSSSDIQDCLDRLAAGDESARARLFERVNDRLNRLTRRMLARNPALKRWEDADDIRQQALLRLHKALLTVQPPKARDFFRLAAWHIRNELNSLARHYFGPEGVAAHHASDIGGESPSRTPPPERQAGDSTHDPARLIAWTDFHEQVQALPELEREVFDLRWVHGLGLKEAAAFLGVSYEVVKKRWQSARHALSDAFDGQMPGA